MDLPKTGSVKDKQKDKNVLLSPVRDNPVDVISPPGLPLLPLLSLIHPSS